jgi:hypothetical protein
VTAERYDGADWPATISVGPGYYGLRLPQEYGTIVEYVRPRDLAIRREEARSVCRLHKAANTGGRCNSCALATITTWTGDALAGLSDMIADADDGELMAGPSGASCEVGM